MTSIRGILLAGLAFWASGCGSSPPPPDADGDRIPDARDACPFDAEDFNGVQDTDGCPETPCSPDLYVNVRIVEDATGAVLTCDQVPATTIRVNISGVVTDFPCPVGVSQQQIPFYLDVTGTYTVMVQLLDGATVLSTTGTNSIDVDCTGQTQTPLIDLAVI